jgi:mannose-1-phosphate guanylyltransferase/mannose-6-phosphate isomerase
MGRDLNKKAGRGGAFHVVLLAGGSGTRFWPARRAAQPKQFLALAGGDSLLRSTWVRVSALAPRERIWVVAPGALARRIERELPELDPGNLVIEPSPRDTAPAIGLACAAVARRDPAAVVGVFPTDHVVGDVRAVVAAVRVAERAARTGKLVCLGVRPERPATGFGYLVCDARPRRGRPCAVERFVEKPALARARRLLASGRALWNGGMFVWRAARFLEELGRAAPATLCSVAATAAGRRGAWGASEKLSVDYAVMEKAQDVAAVVLDAGWDDVGSWEAAARLRADDPDASGRHLLVDSPGTVVFDASGTTAVVGVPGVVVVRTKDALLIVRRERAEDVRLITKALASAGRKELL